MWQISHTPRLHLSKRPAYPLVVSSSNACHHCRYTFSSSRSRKGTTTDTETRCSQLKKRSLRQIYGKDWLETLCPPWVPLPQDGVPRHLKVALPASYGDRDAARSWGVASFVRYETIVWWIKSIWSWKMKDDRHLAHWGKNKHFIATGLCQNFKKSLHLPTMQTT